MNQSQKISAMFLTVFLTACGGGGTTGPLIAPDEPESTPTPAPVPTPEPVPTPPAPPSPPSPPVPSPDPTLYPDASIKVPVAVIDSGFNVNHFEFKDQIIAAADLGGSGTLIDDRAPHGTFVAQVVAGSNVGYSANATLILGKAADANGDIYSDTVRDATNWALSQGAKVINYSLAPMHEIDYFSAQAFENVLNAGAAMVMAAGNKTYAMQSANLSTNSAGKTTIFSPSYLKYADITIMAGALGADNNLTSYSFYPGENTLIQNRFLVVPAPVQTYGLNATSATSPLYDFNGTSGSAPVISAALSTLIAKWPHLTAQESTSILLDSADRTFNSTAYSQNNCGVYQNTNCGAYYFGKGKLDLEAALQPIGPTSIPTGSTVNSAGITLQGFNIALPAAFGTPSTQSIAVSAFDAYGRNFEYAVNPLSVAGNVDKKANGALLEQMQQRTVQSASKQMQLALGFDAHYNVQHSELKMQLNEKSSFAFANRQKDTSQWLSDVPSALGFEQSSALGFYQKSTATSFQMALSPNSSVLVGVAQGNSSELAADESAKVQSSMMGFSFKPSSDATLGVALESSSEKNALMGVRSSALNADSTQYQSLKFSSAYQISPNLQAFGYFSVGSMQSDGYASLARIEKATTTQFMLGSKVQFDDNKSSVLFAISQPLRVQNALVNFSTPVGRNADGTILRANQSVALSPSGRQIDLQVQYARQITPNSSLSVRALYTKEPNHQKGAASEVFVGSNYSLRW